MQKKNQILLLIIGLLVGLLLVSQYQAKPFLIPSDKFFEQKDQTEILESLDKEQSFLKKQIEDLRLELAKLQSTSLPQEDLAVNEELKQKVGLTPVVKPGIRILFDDSADVIRENLDVNNEALVHAADLRDIINLLRVSQAEAVAINGQRILINSTIACVGNSILVNNTNLLPPFQIDVVGDQDFLMTQLKSNLLGIQQRVVDNNLIFKIEKKESLVIPVYNGDLTLEYTSLKEE